MRLIITTLLYRMRLMGFHLKTMSSVELVCQALFAYLPKVMVEKSLL